MRDKGAPGPLTPASAPQAPGRLAREDARSIGGGTLEMAATGVAEHVQRRSGAYWRDLVFSRLLPSLFFSLFLARQLILLGGSVPGIRQPTDLLYVGQQLLALTYFTLLVVLYAVRLPQRGTDRRLATGGLLSALAVAYFIVCELLRIRWEERILAETFPHDYPEYARRVSRYLPNPFARS